MHARTRLLSRSPDVRLAALSDLDPHCTADVYAARAALLSDTDGRVRADAAQVLAKLSSGETRLLAQALATLSHQEA